MTREEKQKAIDALKISAPIMAVTQEEFTDYIQTLNKIMDWLEQEPCEDAISRQAAIDLIADFELSVGQVVRGIHALPSVTPKQRTGHWICTIEDWNKWTCSECGYYTRTDIHVYLGYDYCPKCGCKMEERYEGKT